MGLLVRFESEKAFFSPELMQLGSAKVRSFLAQEPGLAGYRRYLEKELWLEKHTLSPEQEKLLAAVGELTAAPDTIYSMLADAGPALPCDTGRAGPGCGDHPRPLHSPAGKPRPPRAQGRL